MPICRKLNRSLFQDTETTLYYLQSRYYDPALDTLLDSCYNEEKTSGAVLYERKDPDDPGE